MKIKNNGWRPTLKGIDTMANTKKITKATRFNQLLSIDAVKSNPDLVAFIEHELELLAKKNASDKKPTATQIANNGIKETILDTLADNKVMTITEMQKANSELADLSNQKISALVRQLITEGAVKKEEIKRKAYFSLA